MKEGGGGEREGGMKKGGAGEKEGGRCWREKKEAGWWAGRQACMDDRGDGET